MSDSQHKPLSNQPPYYSHDDEITLKELILKLGEFWSELWRYKFWIIGAAILVSILSILKDLRKEVSYSAGLSFTIAQNDDNKESIFYIPYEGYSRGGNQSNRVTELVRSGRIIHKVLLEKANLNDEQDFIANHLIRLYEFDQLWNEQEYSQKYQDLNLKNFSFTLSQCSI